MCIRRQSFVHGPAGKLETRPSVSKTTHASFTGASSFFKITTLCISELRFYVVSSKDLHCVRMFFAEDDRPVAVNSVSSVNPKYLPDSQFGIGGLPYQDFEIDRHFLRWQERRKPSLGLWQSIGVLLRVLIERCPVSGIWQSRRQWKVFCEHCKWSLLCQTSLNRAM